MSLVQPIKVDLDDEVTSNNSLTFLGLSYNLRELRLILDLIIFAVVLEYIRKLLS